MSRFLRFSLCLMLSLFVALPALAATPRILLVGDSWAWFMWLNRSFQEVLQENGLGAWEEAGNFTTVPGSRVKQWTDPGWLENIKKELDRNPEIDIVHISLGGNDFLNNWRPEMSLEARDALFNGVVEDLEVVVQYILDLKPNLRVAIVNYDYINKKKGDGTIQDLNNAGMILAAMKRDLAQRMERTEYVHNYGLMQYHFGVDDLEPKSVPYPGQAPDFEPWPGGHQDYGNPKEAMFDDIHLNMPGYKVLAQHCLDVLYKDWLENPLPAPEAASVGVGSE